MNPTCPSSSKEHTPVMQQYFSVKASYPDIFVLFRMGDFYEFFFEDAVKAAKILDITLTSRGQSGSQPIVMAGFPAQALEPYLAKLLQYSHSVAICEQVAEENTNDAEKQKGLIKRVVTRVVTPGTLTDLALLDEKENALLLAVYPQGHHCGLAWLSLTQGIVFVRELPAKCCNAFFDTLNPKEVLIPTEQSMQRFCIKKNIVCQVLGKAHFSSEQAHRFLCDHFQTETIHAAGLTKNHLGTTAAYALLRYARNTQKQGLHFIKKIIPYKDDEFMELDAPTCRNLELTQTISGKKSPTLFSLLDQCATSLGSRLLRDLLHHPLRDHTHIQQRLDAIEIFFSQSEGTLSLHQAMHNVSDIERLATRLALKLIKPQEIVALRHSLKKITHVRHLVAPHTQHNPLLQKVYDRLYAPPPLLELLENSILDEPALHFKDGGVIAHGYHAELDRLRTLSHDSGKLILAIEQEEREKTHIPNLRIEYNRVHGYCIEITNSYLSHVPPEYQRRQTLKNAERYTTEHLKTLEEEILSAKEGSIQLEKKIYSDVLNQLDHFLHTIQEIAQAYAYLDVIVTQAVLSHRYHYVKPTLTNEPTIQITKGRHPVVEHEVKHFIPNDIKIDPQQQFLLITGPNMGGKSTYMRQAALITLLSHCGFFVPAAQVTMGPVDKIFTRIGAADDLASGQSTFMVEMVESAKILTQATPHTLVIMDEIGRGTSTLDGLSIAHAIACHMMEHLGSYTLFSTHYFELTQLSKHYFQLKNMHLDSVACNDDLVFLHAVKEGAANQSYGLHVAALAGIPAEVIQRAKNTLLQLESSHQSNGYLAVTSEPFSTQPQSNNDLHLQPLIQYINNVVLDEVTPKQALDILFQIKQLCCELVSLSTDSA